MTKDTTTFDLDPESFGGEDFPSRSEIQPMQRTIISTPKDIQAPIVSPEEEVAINAFFKANPHLNDDFDGMTYQNGSDNFYKDEPWIQTYSGRRFNPTKPYVNAIVIQDIAHALSMQCRFSGHVRKFYSVAQHSVLVSYICDSNDALWGLMHDASEAYLVDVPRPLKHSGKIDGYLEYEEKMQNAICKRFGLPQGEPISVKKADKILLSTEARDLMGPLHKDWRQEEEPLPFIINPLPPQDAKDLFMKRFFQLINVPNGYEHYLRTDNRQ